MKIKTAVKAGIAPWLTQNHNETRTTEGKARG
jgi:hypothetical protein